MSDQSLATSERVSTRQEPSDRPGFDPYSSGNGLEHWRNERRRTLDDMRKLDEEIRRERAQNKFRRLMNAAP
jgi:hypothetical protein